MPTARVDRCVTVRQSAKETFNCLQKTAAAALPILTSTEDDFSEPPPEIAKRHILSPRTLQGRTEEFYLPTSEFIFGRKRVVRGAASKSSSSSSLGRSEDHRRKVASSD